PLPIPIDRLVRTHLETIALVVERDWVRKAWLFRTAYAHPVSLVNHFRNTPAIETPVD
ncbi:MAG: hypothetical protein IMZ50_10795, partial [Candidatus Atribacteria bacterium]|nr:hypothetical protein [Candidatus Atribacteria bacterium]